MKKIDLGKLIKGIKEDSIDIHDVIGIIVNKQNETVEWINKEEWKVSGGGEGK